MPGDADLPFGFRQPRQFDASGEARQDGFRHVGKNGRRHTATHQLRGLREASAIVGDAEIFAAFARHGDEFIVEFPAKGGGKRALSKNVRLGLRSPSFRNIQSIADLPERVEFQRPLHGAAPDQSKIIAVVGETLHHILGALVEKMDQQAGNLLPQVGEHRDEHPLDHAVARRKAVFERLVRGSGLEILEPLQMQSDSPGQIQARRGRLDAFAPATGQLDTEELLQLTDLAADQALPHRIAIGDTGDASRFGDRSKVAKPLEGNPAPGEEFFKHDLSVSIPTFLSIFDQLESGDPRLVKTKQTYDIIGDIHGHADELHALLARLGYEKQKGTHAHPEGRMVVFLGDYIDRGPQIREVLQTVRGMVDAGNALAILGNHEVNALWFHTKGPKGRPLRAHTQNRMKQHRATLEQMGEDFHEWMPWLATLPLTFDAGEFRVVHAAWHDDAVAELRAAGPLVGDTLVKYGTEGGNAYKTIAKILNGPEALLPEGKFYTAADGVPRPEIRVKWWLDLKDLNAREALFPDDPVINPDPLRKIPETKYKPGAPITFFGHYAVKAAKPTPITPHLACLDYAIGKGGYLAAYRWDGETELDEAKFVTTNTNPVYRNQPEK